MSLVIELGVLTREDRAVSRHTKPAADALGNFAFWCINGGAYALGFPTGDPQCPEPLPSTPSIVGVATTRTHRALRPLVREYRPSHRDLSAMMAEREVAVSHTTIMRWVCH